MQCGSAPQLTRSTMNSQPKEPLLQVLRPEARDRLQLPSQVAEKGTPPVGGTEEMKETRCF